ncbi:MAG: PLP-dependent transferase, partial [Pseudobdellovibrio sp.]
GTEASNLMLFGFLGELAPETKIVSTVIEHPAIMTHASVPADQRQKLGIDDSLIRLSVGIEDIDDILADLKQAFERVQV